MATFRHGKNTVLKLDNSSNTLVDISNVFDNVNFPRPIATGEVTAFGASAKSYIVGLQDGKISGTGKFDATVDAQITGVITACDAGTLASATFEYGPEGSTTGRVRYTGECFVTSYQVTSPVADVTTFSLELQVTGPVTRNTWP